MFLASSISEELEEEEEKSKQASIFQQAKLRLVWCCCLRHLLNKLPQFNLGGLVLATNHHANYLGALKWSHFKLLLKALSVLSGKHGHSTIGVQLFANQHLWVALFMLSNEQQLRSVKFGLRSFSKLTQPTLCYSYS